MRSLYIQDCYIEETLHQRFSGTYRFTNGIPAPPDTLK